MEKRKEICGHCVSYDMWCGICLNMESRLFAMEAEGIYDYPCCDKFDMEESYKCSNSENEN